MTWFKCIGGSSPEPEDPKFWILNPDVTDEIVDSSSVSTSPYLSFVPFITKVHNNASGGYPVMWGKQNYGGTNKAVIYRGGYETAGISIPIKIPHGKYEKIYIDCQVTQYGSGGYIIARIHLQSALGFDEYGNPSNSIKSVTLVDSSKTPAQINSQTGVVINSTNSSLLSAQTVEIDLTSISQDFYFAFFNCDRSIAIRSIYLE